MGVYLNSPIAYGLFQEAYSLSYYVDKTDILSELVPLVELKKNSRGVRGMKLENGDKLEQVYFPEKEKTAEYRGKEITLGRLKLAKRDGKGTKVRLDR